MYSNEETHVLKQEIKDKKILEFPMRDDEAWFLLVTVTCLKDKRRVILNKLIAKVLSFFWEGYSTLYSFIIELGVDNVTVYVADLEEAGKAMVKLELKNSKGASPQKS